MLGITAAVVLPDFPQTARGFAPELKRVANRRMALEMAEEDVDEASASGMSHVKSFIMAMKDKRI